MTGKWLTINRGNQHSLRKLVILWLVSWRLIGHLLAGTNLFFHVIYLAGKKWILIPSFSHLFFKYNFKWNFLRNLKGNFERSFERKFGQMLGLGEPGGYLGGVTCPRPRPSVGVSGSD